MSMRNRGDHNVGGVSQQGKFGGKIHGKKTADFMLI